MNSIGTFHKKLGKRNVISFWNSGKVVGNKMSNNLNSMNRFVPFNSSESAWLWCCRCRLGIGENPYREFKADEAPPRPCNTIDIYCVIKRLENTNQLNKEHISILAKYGQKLRSPSLSKADPKSEIDLWNEAMDILKLSFKSKGIVG